MSRFKLESVKGGEWVLEYEGDSPAEYAQAVIDAAVGGLSLRHTILNAGVEAPLDSTNTNQGEHL